MKLLDEVITIARQAGEAIMAVYETSSLEVQRKDDHSPLTQADLAAHHVIEAGLRQLTPDFPVLSEESASVPFTTRMHWKKYWLVDPLDGTREFIKRNGEFTVNIALVDGHDPVLGVVYAPAMDLLFYACKGGGAYKQAAHADAERISTRVYDAAALTVAGSRSHADEALLRFIKRIGPCEMVSLGSSLKICLVAEGRADIYPRLGPTSEWDTAAAQCVLAEAGGALIGLNGGKLRYNTKESMLNPYFLAVGDERHNWISYADNQHE